MDGKGTISDYRSKMDTTLASPDLTNHEKLQTLVRNQILQYSDLQLEGCIENVIERRSNELSNFLGMLRSTADSDRSNSSWKVKHDTEEFRVMYREGPEGTPLHTLLVEGYVDGPLDVCMCISWESGLYSKWWPQTAIPSFKVISSRCLQRVGPGEQISLVRMKVSWPLSSREAVIHYFAFEYFQDDLMVVLLNSISDSETINRHSHGFTRDGIPNAEELVRIDVVGGFALQKVTAERSYFRTIANMDIKLDFVPPSFLNFVSRQLAGSGFNLYKKEVASVSKGDQKFCEALKDPLYARIRQALDPYNSAVAGDEKKSTFGMQSREEDDNAVDSEAKRNEVEKSEGGEMMDDCSLKSAYCTSDGYCSGGEEEGCKDETTEGCRDETRKEVRISGEVAKALLTLENVIAIFNKQQRSETNLENDQISGSSTSVEPTIILENHASRLRRETSESKVEISNSKNRALQLQPSMNHNLENVTKNEKHRFCCFALHLPLLRIR
ncbi:uncharacterized protein LOC121762938 isoform X2 [Salvia splendens]|uniref:uncharacterized protein LOC121762938 isoform X2 n=1 Tax=Salvia splendens TaxID=180675 RepID=UPI001C26BF71|nr:uncharacterized protein LOC121762938 isoform X2 [Salvia splendens]